ncbi:uncharacterized protein LOC118266310 [Spodoptera frugiperda]|uniref:Uncharacterized protein LOC118266310 n=1 Tax=Spodoptera frugiperda TaxID=7108 RepID=A0A9R0CZX7_SPOFR|nr:uncharacterized protein LOC118266310 [Spodoptera frugiperda]
MKFIVCLFLLLVMLGGFQCAPCGLLRRLFQPLRSRVNVENKLINNGDHNVIYARSTLLHPARNELINNGHHNTIYLRTTPFTRYHNRLVNNGHDNAIYVRPSLFRPYERVLV